MVGHKFMLADSSHYLFFGVISTHLLVITINVLAVLIVGVLIYKFFAQRDRIGSHAPKVKGELIADGGRIEATPEEEMDQPTAAPDPEPQQTVDDLIHSIDSEDARELVKERDSELVRRLEDWALEVVDTMDELSRMPQEKGMAAYIERLRCQLTALDCTLIDSDKWDPDLQRAVKVEEATTPGSAPCITRKISTGLRVREKLVRKQTVIIEK